jgi:hypothetical protein
MLYKIIHDKDTFELNPEIKAIAEFADLTDRQFRFVALVADRRTPLRTLPDKQRREKATMICGYGMEGNRPDKNARTLIAGQLEKVDEIKEYLKSDKKNTRDYGKALEQATKLGSKLPELVEAKQKLESLLNITVEQKPEITTYSSLDLPEEAIQEGAEDLPAIEMYHKTQKKEG